MPIHPLTQALAQHVDVPGRTRKALGQDSLSQALALGVTHRKKAVQNQSGHQDLSDTMVRIALGKPSPAGAPKPSQAEVARCRVAVDEAIQLDAETYQDVVDTKLMRGNGAVIVGAGMLAAGLVMAASPLGWAMAALGIGSAIAGMIARRQANHLAQAAASETQALRKAVSQT